MVERLTDERLAQEKNTSTFDTVIAMTDTLRQRILDAAKGAYKESVLFDRSCVSDDRIAVEAGRVAAAREMALIIREQIVYATKDGEAVEMVDDLLLVVSHEDEQQKDKDQSRLAPASAIAPERLTSLEETQQICRVYVAIDRKLHPQRNADARRRRRINQRAEIRRLHRHIRVLNLTLDSVWNREKEWRRRVDVAERTFAAPQVKRRWPWGPRTPQ